MYYIYSMKFKPTLHFLSNGIPVILDHMDIATATMVLKFNTGPRNEGPDNTGITHFVEHMLLKGTPLRPTLKAVFDFVKNHGGTIGAQTEHTKVSIDGRIIAKNLPILADVIGDNIKNALFDADAIETEKSVILEEYMRYQNDDNNNGYYFITRNIFPNSHFPNDTLGNPDTIKSFTREQLLDWKDTRLSASNAAIVISGKIIDRAKLLSDLERLFGWLPARKIPAIPTPQFKACAAHSDSLDKNTKITICIKDKTSNDLENHFQQMCISRFKSAFSARLFDTIRSQNGLTYGINTGYTGGAGVGANTIKTSTAPKNAKKVMDLIADVAYDMTHKNLYTKEELTLFKNGAMLADASMLESPAQRIGVLFDRWFSYGILFDWDDCMRISKRITTGDVIESAKDIFDAPTSVITQGAKVGPRALRQIWLEKFKS